MVPLCACEESFGLAVTDAEQDYLESLGMKMRPSVEERECGLCTRVRLHTEFMSTKGEFSYAICRCFLLLALKSLRMFSNEYASCIKSSFWRLFCLFAE